MRTLPRLALVAAIVAAPALLLGQGQGVAPEALLKPLSDSWPTYSGDYSGRRYSALKQITRKTVTQLTLLWSTALDDTARGAIVGGEGTDEFPSSGVTIKGTPLMVDDTLYVSAPDHAWALDARDGRVLWHYF
jgi:alcohol dehydrogenase (cytochrome c)